MAKAKQYTIVGTRYSTGVQTRQTGTLEELIECYRYTLECGKSWEHEKGNKKINLNPKTVKSLVTQINNAANNSASNGYADRYYELEA